jgi:hypothetical protein
LAFLSWSTRQFLQHQSISLYAFKATITKKDRLLVQNGSFLFYQDSKYAFGRSLAGSGHLMATLVHMALPGQKGPHERESFPKHFCTAKNKSLFLMHKMPGDGISPKSLNLWGDPFF